MHGALILDADVRALGIARSLGRQGVPVHVLWRTGDRIARHSRYVRSALRWPSDDVEERMAFLRHLAEDGYAGWTLFATHDEVAAMVSRNNEELARSFRLDTPAWPAFGAAYDKRCAYALADELGVPGPATWYPESVEDLADLDLVFPVILKPSVKHEENAFTVDKAWPASDLEALVRQYDLACRFVPSETIMVQELIPGGGECQFSFAALCRDGVPVASLVARRTRQYPRDFGHSSSFVETVDEPEVEMLGRQFLKGLGYTGLIEVEFKRDPRTNALRVLDINPRVWTWHTLGERAGVDFPYLAWLISQGHEVPETRGRTGSRWMRPATDVLAAAAEIRDGRLAVQDYLGTIRRTTAMCPHAWDDPLPSVIDLPMLAARTLTRRARLRRGLELRAQESEDPSAQQRLTWGRS